MSESKQIPKIVQAYQQGEQDGVNARPNRAGEFKTTAKRAYRNGYLQGQITRKSLQAVGVMDKDEPEQPDPICQCGRTSEGRCRKCGTMPRPQVAGSISPSVHVRRRGGSHKK